MKPFLALLLAILLGLSLVSCISIPTEEQDPTSEISSPSATTVATTLPPNSPPAVDFSDPDLVSRAFLDPTAETIVDVSKREYSYTEMVEDLEALADAHPTRFSYRSFGKSVAGRDLYVAILGNPNASQQVLVSAGLHGREYLTPLLVMKQLEFYSNKYGLETYYNSGFIDAYDLLTDTCIIAESGASGVAAAVYNAQENAVDLILYFINGFDKKIVFIKIGTENTTLYLDIICNLTRCNCIDIYLAAVNSCSAEP